MIGIRRNNIGKILLGLFLIYIYYFIFKYVFNMFASYESPKVVHDVSNHPVSLEYYPDRNTHIVEEKVVAVVACGERLQETLTMLKSCLLFSTKSRLRFVVIADDKLVLGFKDKLSEWQQILNGSFQFEVLNLRFPEKDADDWRKLFKPCASQRLFLPTLLPHIDSLIYLDTDTLFLSPVESLWKHFKEFNSSQMAALAIEHEDPNVSWYSRFAKHPYYGKLGVNSGVMLMNLTRLRSFHWEDYVTSVYHQWRTQLTWGDQDIINIIFHYHSDKLQLLSCDANYRPDQCSYGSACSSAAEHGVRVLHGSRSAFHFTKEPAFSAIYKAARDYQLGTDPVKYFLNPLLENLKSAPESNCGKLADVLTKLPREILEKKHPDIIS